ncbi:hypothetical protein E8D34_20605 [Nocardioides sp. GY 10113]|uniref:endonuclease/exonuclease/phosphatase family protein n=1 Tax=Nocardioides sp. GY 10113 TaxID=2569761 RepID=UPI0010A7E775|nr:endonuclease/exonuclease/phosphatase family protein [Nocardioides sp. GY 10113]TIC79154.1 hypothetical protein E8D34_20605 [Nocardioides sp. GY 10113]
MRIGTWNLAGRWGDQHRQFLDDLDCEVLLLTEVSDRVDLPERHGHVTGLLMAQRRHWAGVWTARPHTPLPDPHGASAMVEYDDLRLCSSILPWRSCGSGPPWVGATTFERTVEAVDAIAKHSPTVWGGDWNHALLGAEYAGSAAGRDRIVEALDQLGLRAPTADAPHQIEGLSSIDHIAVPLAWEAKMEHHSALLDEGRLSDHDAYVIEVPGR